MSVVIETTIGDLTVDLFIEERPIACINFLKLCKLKYYNYNLFHTIEQGFIAQTGDPTGVGDGGSSVWGVVEGAQKRFFEAESLPKIHHSTAGLLSLVSAGKNLAGSQFFFTLGDNLTSLDGIHCVIGEVVEGHETLRKLNDAIVDEKFRPYQDVRITHTVVLDDPLPTPRGFQVPSRSPSPTAERLKNGRIAADEDIDDTDGKTMEELQELLAEREAKARATILEIVGDLPDADMAPPENVLFVCKLNPVTTDDDLEIIFSRFGVVKSCEVIRDKKTGDSLQYAFVEFEEQNSCEAAYFKMDNVLIDDRRIHVDFSQSVAKVKWRGKGRGVDGQEGRLDFSNLKGGHNDRRHREERGRPVQRRRGEQEVQRPRMSSSERRKEREARHREQRVREDTREQRGREDTRDRREQRMREDTREQRGREDTRDRREQRVREDTREQRHRAQDDSYRRRSRSNDNQRNRRRSPDRRDRHSVERYRDDRRRDDARQNRRDAPERRRYSPTRRSPERREYGRDQINRNAERRESTERNLKNSNSKAMLKNSKSKKSKKLAKSSSSEDSSDDSDETSSSSSSSCTCNSSSSDSSSSDERNKHKRSKKSKKSKSKKSKSKRKKKHKKNK